MLRVKHLPPMAAVLLVLSFAGTAFSAEISANTVACQTADNLARYQRLEAAGEDVFVKDMLARAQCYVTGRAHNVLLVSSIEGAYQVELASGHKGWVPEIVAEEAAKPAEKNAE